MSLAEIIAVGSELLLGGRQDTNSLFVADALASVGIEVRYKSIVGDVVPDIADAVRTACRRVDVVILTGGLGPTADDCTRQAVAQAAKRRLMRNARALDLVRQQLAQWGRTPRPQQLRQGSIPAGAEVIRNPVGSAPGFWLRLRGRHLIALPGVPAELEQMMRQEVLPRLIRGVARSSSAHPIERRVLTTVGLVESEIEERLEGLVPPRSHVRVGLLASPLGVSVSLTATRRAGQREGSGRQSRGDDLDRLTAQIRRRLGAVVLGEGADSMEGIVGQALTARGLTLALAESCTGGLIGHRLTQIPGSSSYLDRSIVCYSNEAKHELLGVPRAILRRHGAVSAQVAAAMAEGVRRRSRTKIGLSVTGIAGPSGGTPAKPVGLTYIGLASVDRPRVNLTKEFRFHGTREMVKLRASQAALNLLRLYLADLHGKGSR